MNKLKYLSLAFAAVLGLSACSGDDPEKPEKPGEPGGKMEQMTPLEAKTFLSDASKEFLGKFRAADQRDLIVLASHFDEAYGDLDMPEEFEIEADNARSAVRDLIHGLSAGLSQGNASRAGSAVIEYVYTINFNRFTGVYEPGRYEWKRTADNKDIIFRFTGESGQECELKATASAGTSDITINVSDYDYEYDYTTGTYEEWEENHAYVCAVPKNVVVTLTSGGKELVKAVVDSDINVKDNKLSVTTSVSAMNLVAAVKVNANDTKATLEASLKVSDETVVSSSATINGSHLCDKDYYENDPQLVTLFQSGTAAVSALNKVRVDAQVTYNALVDEILDYPWWDNYDYSSKDAAKNAAESAVATLNNNIKAQLRFNNKETVQADIIFGTTFDSWGSGWEYGMEPLMKFTADQTEYSFEEYFEKGFASVEDAWSDLQRSYEKIWDSVRK